MKYIIVKNEGDSFGKPLIISNIVAIKNNLSDAQKEHAILCNSVNDCKAYSIRGPYTDDTELEAFIMVQNGMKCISAQSLVLKLTTLGYKIDPVNSFNYINTNNKRQYKARSIYIVESNTGLSFANINARCDDNFKELQSLRYNTFVYHNGRIWEI